jgi:amino acid adenylation domain-containing protein
LGFSLLSENSPNIAQTMTAIVIPNLPDYQACWSPLAQVQLWSVVAVVSLFVWFVRHRSELEWWSQVADAFSRWRLKATSVHALEEGLLSKEKAKGNDLLPVSGVFEISALRTLCQEQGLEHGIQTACLGLVLIVQSRCQYVSTTASLLLHGPSTGSDVAEKQVDVEIDVGTTFVALLKIVEDALGFAADGATEKSEVSLAWDMEPTTPLQWSTKLEGPDHMKLTAPSQDALDAFKKLFAACMSSPEQDAFSVDLLTEAVHTKLSTWGDSTQDITQVEGIGAVKAGIFNWNPLPQLLADCAFSHDAEAVVGDGFRITQGQVRERFAAVAHAVRHHVDTESRDRPVAIFMGRGEMIIPAFLGAWEAGYHVVPMDVHWPADRMRSVFDAAKPLMVLVDATTKSKWLDVEVGDVPCVQVDASLWSTTDAVFSGNAPPNASNCLAKITQDDPAVLLFTSGSTGQPKGIVLSHRYLTYLLAVNMNNKQVTNRSRWLNYFSPTWMPFLDSFSALAKGGTIVMHPEGGDHIVKPFELAASVSKHRATHFASVPAMFEILCEEGLPQSLTHCGSGGAPINQELLCKGLQALPAGARFTFGYSGTEFSLVTCHAISSDADISNWVNDKGFLHTGFNNGGQRLAILDKGLNMVLPGHVGEICVGGPGLATGYLHLPEKTAETFLANCATMGGMRTARSGDLGSWDHKGNLIVCGRRDGMVKVRGARIEIGEVEAIVGKHPDIRDCVVVVRDDRLVAYVVPAVPVDVREHCKRSLAAYMVPHSFEGLDELPKLPNGKINKRGLPDPAEGGAEVVMELDSLGQMRKFTRLSASEDRILDNVRAILLAVVIQSHNTPMSANSQAMCVGHPNDPVPIGGDWTTVQYVVLMLLRSGGWSSLSFLSGFDDTRGITPFSLNYREFTFIAGWLVFQFNWTLWYLVVFFWMRGAFCVAHRLGCERLHMLIASQTWILLPAFVNFYVGYQTMPADPLNPQEHAACPSGTFCPFQLPYIQNIAHFGFGWQWWAGESFLLKGLVFVPCYWLGFYFGRPIFAYLVRLCEDPSRVRRTAVTAAVLAVYMVLNQFKPTLDGLLNDHSENFWNGDVFVWQQVVYNVGGFLMSLVMSLQFVVIVAAAFPLHLQYLAKVCFAALLLSPFTPCALSLPMQVMQLRQILPAMISPSIEMVWILGIPLLYILVAGAVLSTLMQRLVLAGKYLLQNGTTWVTRHLK